MAGGTPVNQAFDAIALIFVLINSSLNAYLLILLDQKVKADIIYMINWSISSQSHSIVQKEERENPVQLDNNPPEVFSDKEMEGFEGMVWKSVNISQKETESVKDNGNMSPKATPIGPRFEGGENLNLSHSGEAKESSKSGADDEYNEANERKSQARRLSEKRFSSPLTRNSTKNKNKVDVNQPNVQRLSMASPRQAPMEFQEFSKLPPKAPVPNETKIASSEKLGKRKSWKLFGKPFSNTSSDSSRLAMGSSNFFSLTASRTDFVGSPSIPGNLMKTSKTSSIGNFAFFAPQREGEQSEQHEEARLPKWSGSRSRSFKNDVEAGPSRHFRNSPSMDAAPQVNSKNTPVGVVRKTAEADRPDASRNNSKNMHSKSQSFKDAQVTIGPDSIIPIFAIRKATEAERPDASRSNSKNMHSKSQSFKDAQVTIGPDSIIPIFAIRKATEAERPDASRSNSKNMHSKSQSFKDAQVTMGLDLMAAEVAAQRANSKNLNRKDEPTSPRSVPLKDSPVAFDISLDEVPPRLNTKLATRNLSKSFHTDRSSPTTTMKKLPTETVSASTDTHAAALENHFVLKGFTVEMADDLPPRQQKRSSVLRSSFIAKNRPRNESRLSRAFTPADFEGKQTSDGDPPKPASSPQ